MSILWCGGEPLDFDPLGSVFSVDTYSTYHRPDYARCALATDANYHLRTPNFGEQTELWFSSRVRIFSLSINKRGIEFASSGDSYSSTIRVSSNSATSSVLDIIVNDSVVASSSAGVLTSTELFKIDVHVDYSVTGTVEVYIDGNLVVSYSGDITMAGVTGFDTVIINTLSSTISTYITVYSEFIVADEDTRLMSLKTLVPNAAGDASDWTNDYTSIDELEVSDADTVFTETVDESFQCNLTGMPTGDFIVKAVKQVARMTDGVGGMGVQMGIKTNSTDNLESTITLGSVWDSYENIYNENPVTTNRFTPEEIDALQLSFKSVAV